MKRTKYPLRDPYPAPPGPQGAYYAVVLRGPKRIEAVLKPDAAAALTVLRERTGRTYSAIIEGLLLAEYARDLKRVG